MTSVEIQALSVDEAIRLALEQLDLNESDVDIEVLSDAGPDEDAEALVRVTAKGMASQPVPSGKSSQKDAGRPKSQRRAPGDRPSQRGEGHRRDRQPAPPPRVYDPNRADTEDEATAKEIVAELLGHMGIVAEVVATDNPSSMDSGEEDPPTIFIDVLGQDLGLLIGRRGEHLAHLQYIVNLIANKRLGDYTRVIVDVEAYRTRREESLIALAERVARQVSRSGRPIVLEPMPPNERRVVHMTLREHPEVATESNGEGQDRRITVMPRA
ncbi:MAG: KH domain-containing protein [Thermomicrobiales bacterium]|nr:MAG: KH domain-containing protein [Thermomicrobiales bacterium]